MLMRLSRKRADDGVRIMMHLPGVLGQMGGQGAWLAWRLLDGLLCKLMAESLWEDRITSYEVVSIE